MKKETIKEKRANTLDELSIAKMEVDFKRLQLKTDIKNINSILRRMKKIRKVITSFNFILHEWKYNNLYEEQLKIAKQTLLQLSHFYDEAILKRKLLKNEFKQAQRKFAKKQKRIKDFDKKYFLGEVSNGKE